MWREFSCAWIKHLWWFVARIFGMNAEFLSLHAAIADLKTAL